MGRAIALQIAMATPGIRLAAIASRRVDQAARAFADAGQLEARSVRTPQEIQDAIDSNVAAVAEDWRLLCSARNIEAVLEVTGTIEYGAHVVSSAIANRKHVILMNSALDGTVGPVLKHRADKMGVVYTNVDGDAPGAVMNLVRFVKGLGLNPVVCGVFTARPDPRSNPTSVAEFAQSWGQKPHRISAIRDGTKMCFDLAVLANATAMGVSPSGLIGPAMKPGTPTSTLAASFTVGNHSADLNIVDFIVSSQPSRGGFVLASARAEPQRRYLAYYERGSGPLYCFQIPFQIGHFAVPSTIARAVLLRDAAIAPAGAATVEVVAAAKTRLRAGVVLDDIGQFMTYGRCVNADRVRAEGLLPLGIAAGCRIRQSIDRDSVLHYSDVELPAARLIDRLRSEQESILGSPRALTGARRSAT